MIRKKNGVKYAIVKSEAKIHRKVPLVVRDTPVLIIGASKESMQKKLREDRERRVKETELLLKRLEVINEWNTQRYSRV